MKLRFRRYQSIAFVALWVVGGLAPTSQAALIFFSRAGLGQGAILDNPELTLIVGEEATLNIWASLEPDEVLVSVGLDLETDTPGVVSYQNSEMINPAVVVGGSQAKISDRWSTVSNGDPGAGSLLAQDLWGQAIGLPNGALDQGHTGTPFLDQGYDQDMDTFLLGSVTLQADRVGTTSLHFLVDEILILRDVDGTTLGARVTFGVDDVEVDGATEGAKGDNPDAIINVVPEPSSLLTLAIGFAAIRRPKASQR